MRYVRPATALASLVLAGVAALGACTSTVDGEPSFAGDEPSGVPTESPSGLPTGPTGGGIEIPSSGASGLPSAPSASASSGAPSGSPSGSTGEPAGLCAVIPADELEQIFASPTTTSEGDPTHCTYTSEEPYLTFSVGAYDNLTVKEQLDILGGGRRTQFFGQPGGIGKSGSITVSTAGDYSRPGILSAFCGSDGQQIAIKVLEKLYPHVAGD